MNTDDLVAGLRGAYRARADLVTRDTLTLPAQQPDLGTHYVAHDGHTHRGARRLQPLLAAAAVIGLVVSVTVLAHVMQPRKAQPGHLTSSVWNGVEPGWTLAFWIPSATATTETLYLIDPTGHRTSVGTYPAAKRPAIIDWSRDHTKVLIVFDSASLVSTTESLDLRTGERTTFTEAVTSSLSYFSADGSTLMRFDPAHQLYEVIDGTGHRTSVLATPRIDSPRAPLRATLAGEQLTIFGGRRLVVLPDGGRARTLALPPGRSECDPLRMWTGDSVLVDCDLKQAWTVPLDGSAPTALAVPATKYVKTDPLEFGDIDAWQIGGRVYLRQPVACLGFVGIATAGPDKVPHDLAIPVSAPALSGVSDSAFYFVSIAGGCKGDGGDLYSWVPTEARPKLLLGGSVNGGTVLDAKTLGPDR